MKKRIMSLLTIILIIVVSLSTAGAEEIMNIGRALLEQFGEFAQPDSTAESGDKNDAESEWENILLLGCDAHGDSMRLRTDSIVILSLNAITGQAKITSLMRDTWMVASGKEGHHKLTEFNVWGGPEMTMRAINENYGMKLTKYVLVNMKGLAEIVDILGGVDVEITNSERNVINRSVDWNMSSRSEKNTLTESGLVHLNGCQALTYARIRHLDSDYIRTERQRNVLVAMAKKARNEFGLESVFKLIGVLSDYVETNLSTADILRLAETALCVDVDAVEQYRIPVDGTFDSGMYGNTWCIKPDFAENAKLLHEFIYSE